MNHSIDWFSKLHRACFAPMRSWTEEEFTILLNAPDSVVVINDGGFALGRVMADEAEILTICVAEAERRRHIGRTMLGALEKLAMNRGARRIFLEVAADNQAALSLYLGDGYDVRGLRPKYYKIAPDRATDALILGKALPKPTSNGGKIPKR